MPAVRPADRGDMRGMARCLQPVVDGRPNSAAFNRRLAGTMVSGDQQDHAVPGRSRAPGRIDHLPRPVEIHAVQVDHRSGSTAPERSRRSQLPSSVVPEPGAAGAAGDAAGASSIGG